MAGSDLERFLNHIANLLQLFITRNQQQVRRRAISQSYTVIQPSLPESHRNTQSPFFSFAVPVGWRDLTMEERYRLSRVARGTVLSGVTTIRSDLLTTNFIVSADMSEDADEEEFLEVLGSPDKVLNIRLQALSGRPLSRPIGVLLGGHRALLIHISSQAPGQLYGQTNMIPVVQSEVHVVAGRRQFVLMMTGPSGFHSDLLPAFWTMLGTWSWHSY